MHNIWILKFDNASKNTLPKCMRLNHRDIVALYNSGNNFCSLKYIYLPSGGLVDFKAKS